METSQLLRLPESDDFRTLTILDFIRDELKRGNACPVSPPTLIPLLRARLTGAGVAERWRRPTEEIVLAVVQLLMELLPSLLDEPPAYLSLADVHIAQEATFGLFEDVLAFIAKDRIRRAASVLLSSLCKRARGAFAEPTLRCLLQRGIASEEEVLRRNALLLCADVYRSSVLLPHTGILLPAVVQRLADVSPAVVSAAQRLLGRMRAALPAFADLLAALPPDAAALYEAHADGPRTQTAGTAYTPVATPGTPGVARLTSPQGLPARTASGSASSGALQQLSIGGTSTASAGAPASTAATSINGVGVASASSAAMGGGGAVVPVGARAAPQTSAAAPRSGRAAVASPPPDAASSRRSALGTASPHALSSVGSWSTSAGVMSVPPPPSDSSAGAASPPTPTRHAAPHPATSSGASPGLLRPVDGRGMDAGGGVSLSPPLASLAALEVSPARLTRPAAAPPSATSSSSAAAAAAASTSPAVGYGGAAHAPIVAKAPVSAMVHAPASAPRAQPPSPLLTPMQESAFGIALAPHAGLQPGRSAPDLFAASAAAAPAAAASESKLETAAAAAAGAAGAAEARASPLHAAGATPLPLPSGLQQLRASRVERKSDAGSGGAEADDSLWDVSLSRSHAPASPIRTHPPAASAPLAQTAVSVGVQRGAEAGVAASARGGVARGDAAGLPPPDRAMRSSPLRAPSSEQLLAQPVGSSSSSAGGRGASPPKIADSPVSAMFNAALNESGSVASHSPTATAAQLDRGAAPPLAAPIKSWSDMLSRKTGAAGAGARGDERAHPSPLLHTDVTAPSSPPEAARATARSADSGRGLLQAEQRVLEASGGSALSSNGALRERRASPPVLLPPSAYPPRLSPHITAPAPSLKSGAAQADGLHALHVPALGHSASGASLPPSLFSPPAAAAASSDGFVVPMFSPSDTSGALERGAMFGGFVSPPPSSDAGVASPPHVMLGAAATALVADEAAAAAAAAHYRRATAAPDEATAEHEAEVGGGGGGGGGGMRNQLDLLKRRSRQASRSRRVVSANLTSQPLQADARAASPTPYAANVQDGGWDAPAEEAAAGDGGGSRYRAARGRMGVASAGAAVGADRHRALDYAAYNSDAGGEQLSAVSVFVPARAAHEFGSSAPPTPASDVGFAFHHMRSSADDARVSSTQSTLSAARSQLPSSGQSSVVARSSRALSYHPITSAGGSSVGDELGGSGYDAAALAAEFGHDPYASTPPSPVKDMAGEGGVAVARSAGLMRTGARPELPSGSTYRYLSAPSHSRYAVYDAATAQRRDAESDDGDASFTLPQVARATSGVRGALAATPLLTGGGSPTAGARPPASPLMLGEERPIRPMLNADAMYRAAPALISPEQSPSSGGGGGGGGLFASPPEGALAAGARRGSGGLPPRAAGPSVSSRASARRGAGGGGVDAAAAAAAFVPPVLVLPSDVAGGGARSDFEAGDASPEPLLSSRSQAVSVSPSVRKAAAHGGYMHGRTSPATSFDAAAAAAAGEEEAGTARGGGSRAPSRTPSASRAVAAYASAMEEGGRARSQAAFVSGAEAVYIPSSQLTPIPLQPEAALRNAATDVAKDNWEKQFEALNTLRRIALFHTGLLTAFPQLPVLLSSILVAVDSLRSSVAKNAMMALVDMFSALGPAVETGLDAIVSILLKRATDTNVFISAAADSALAALVLYGADSRVLPAMLAATAHRNTSIRLKAALWLDRATAAMGPRVTANARDLDRVISIAAKYMGEGNPEARHAGHRILYRLLRTSCIDARTLSRVLPDAAYARIRSNLDRPPASSDLFDLEAAVAAVVTTALSPRASEEARTGGASSTPASKLGGGGGGGFGFRAPSASPSAPRAAAAAAGGGFDVGGDAEFESSVPPHVHATAPGSAAAHRRSASSSRAASRLRRGGSGDRLASDASAASIAMEEAAAWGCSSSGGGGAPPAMRSRSAMRGRADSAASGSDAPGGALLSGTPAETQEAWRAHASQLNAPDWKERVTALMAVGAWVKAERCAGTSLALSVADELSRRIADGNKQVVQTALNTADAFMPHVAPDAQDRVLALLLPPLATALISSARPIADAASNVLQHMQVTLDAAVLLPSMAAVSRNANVKIKGALLERMAPLIRDAHARRPGVLARTLLPVVLESCDDVRPEIRSALPSVVDACAACLGAQAIMDAAKTMQSVQGGAAGTAASGSRLSDGGVERLRRMLSAVAGGSGR